MRKASKSQKYLLIMKSLMNKSMNEKFRISNQIIESNNQFLLANKPFGIPVQDDLTEDSSWTAMVRNYCKHKVHLITRLDRPVGGITLFSKSAQGNVHLNNSKLIKRYIAIVEGKLEAKDWTTLSNQLFHDTKLKKAFINPKRGQTAELKYRSLQVLERYTIVEVELISGRFHQIRAQLAHLGHAIKGDVKYGARRSNKDRSIHLFAYHIELTHPVSQKSMQFQATLPSHDALWLSAFNFLNEEKDGK